MRSFFSTVLLIFVLSLLTANTNAQVFTGNWHCLYATQDDRPNGTGYPTASVGVIKPNTFVALVSRKTATTLTCYLVGYTNASTLTGRMGVYGYGTTPPAVAGMRQVWASGFDNVEMLEAYDISVTKDSLVYVANNDMERNILVFRMSADSVISTEYRMVSTADSLWGIDVDNNGKVYVGQCGIGTNPGKILVFRGISEDAEWAGLHNSAPIQTINIPDPGRITGVTVNAEGTLIYASNYDADKVYCFIGSPTTGYTLFNGFTFNMTDQPMASNGVDTIFPGPLGLKYMETKNILMVSCAQLFRLGVAYEYSRAYMVNPNTGVILDTLDAAKWSYDQTGSYTTPNDSVSAYNALYNADYDQDFNVYTVSYYGWTIDKWYFDGVIPTVPVTILGLEKNEGITPSEFTLSQNYPNPFNPSTTIDFSITDNSVVNLFIYDLNGQLVTELIKGASLEKGSYKVSFDASRLASGMYIYTLQTGERQLTKKMSFIK
ncbi:MAG: T9SS type A sorting domain-containing protein [Ignavibacteriaceae bacterium]